jgi:hypothetical protein
MSLFVFLRVTLGLRKMSRGMRRWRRRLRGRRRCGVVRRVCRRGRWRFGEERDIGVLAGNRKGVG